MNGPGAKGIPRAPTDDMLVGEAHQSSGSKHRRAGTTDFPRSTRRRSARPDLVELRLRLRLPQGWGLEGFLAAHPDLVVEALARHTASPRSVVVEFQIRGGDDRDWGPELNGLPNVVSVRHLARIGRPNVYQVEWRAPLEHTALLRRYDLIGAVPIVMAQGHASLSLALTKPRLQMLVRELRRRGFQLEVVEVRPLRGALGLEGLTPKQRARFQAAVDAGYFDVPRRVTLEELARRSSVRKSAFSESLALARRKILVAAGRALTSGDESARAALIGTA
jgi:predicted DNA binding protein